MNLPRRLMMMLSCSWRFVDRLGARASHPPEAGRRSGGFWCDVICHVSDLVYTVIRVEAASVFKCTSSGVQYLTN